MEIDVTPEIDCEKNVHLSTPGEAENVETKTCLSLESVIEDDLLISTDHSKLNNNTNKKATKYALRQQAKRRRKNTTIASGNTSSVPRIIVKPLPPQPVEEAHSLPVSPLPSKIPTMKEVLASIPGFTMKPRKRSNKKLSTAAQLEQTKEGCIDLETPDSILVHTNLRLLLNRATFASLPLLYQHKLALLLPNVDRHIVSNSSDPNSLDISNSGLNNEFFARACIEWQDRLAEGEFTPENQQKLKLEGDKERSKLDPWKLKHFEPIWGDRTSGCSYGESESGTPVQSRPSLKTTIKLRPSSTVSNRTKTAAPVPPKRLRTVGAVTRSCTKETELHLEQTLKSSIPDLLPIKTHKSQIFKEEKLPLEADVVMLPLEADVMLESENHEADGYTNEAKTEAMEVVGTQHEIEHIDTSEIEPVVIDESELTSTDVLAENHIELNVSEDKEKIATDTDDSIIDVSENVLPNQETIIICEDIKPSRCEKRRRSSSPDLTESSPKRKTPSPVQINVEHIDTEIGLIIEESSHIEENPLELENPLRISPTEFLPLEENENEVGDKEMPESNEVEVEFKEVQENDMLCENILESEVISDTQISSRSEANDEDTTTRDTNSIGERMSNDQEQEELASMEEDSVDHSEYSYETEIKGENENSCDNQENQVEPDPLVESIQSISPSPPPSPKHEPVEDVAEIPVPSPVSEQPAEVGMDQEEDASRGESDNIQAPVEEKMPEDEYPKMEEKPEASPETQHCDARSDAHPEVHSEVPEDVIEDTFQILPNTLILQQESLQLEKTGCNENCLNESCIEAEKLEATVEESDLVIAQLTDTSFVAARTIGDDEPIEDRFIDAENYVLESGQICVMQVEKCDKEETEEVDIAATLFGGAVANGELFLFY